MLLEAGANGTANIHPTSQGDYNNGHPSNTAWHAQQGEGAATQSATAPTAYEGAGGGATQSATAPTAYEGAGGTAGQKRFFTVEHGNQKAFFTMSEYPNPRAKKPVPLAKVARTYEEAYGKGVFGYGAAAAHQGSNYGAAAAQQGGNYGAAATQQGSYYGTATASDYGVSAAQQGSQYGAAAAQQDGYYGAAAANDYSASAAQQGAHYGAVTGDNYSAAAAQQASNYGPNATSTVSASGYSSYPGGNATYSQTAGGYGTASGPYGATSAYGYGSAAPQSGPTIQQDFYADAYTGQWDSSSGGQSSSSVAVYPDGDQSAAAAHSAQSYSGYGTSQAGTNTQWNPYIA